MDAGAARARSVTWPTPEVWFNPWVPDGTVLAPIERSLRPGRHARPPVPMLEEYHRLAPSDSWVSWALAWWRLPSGPPTVASLREHSGLVLDYDVTALRRIFEGIEMSQADSVRLATGMCEIDVDQCDRLAAEHLKNGEDAQAADEYRRWFTRARNRVSAANGVLWLVRYLDDAGLATEAHSVAAAASEVGSGTGMATLAEVLERRGDLAGAEAAFKRIQGRYDIGWHLGAYYLRAWRRSGDAFARDRGLALVADRFPAGLEEAPASGPAPVNGVRFTSFGQRAARAGLLRDDVVVGIDGVRVRNVDQATVILRASDSASMTFAVWRDGAYLTVRANVPQRWLGSNTATYRGPAPTQ
jgi:PDZ domain